MKKIIKKFQNASPALKASIAYTICSILQKTLSLITLPLFTRLLSTEQYGQYSIYTSWSSIFSIIITLNLAYGSFGKAMISFKNERRQYISSVQFLISIIAIVFCCACFIFSKYISEWLSLPIGVVYLMIFEIICQFSLQCWYGLKRYEFKYWPVIIVTLISSLLSPTLALILVNNFEEKGIARIAGYAMITIFIGLIIYVINCIKGRTFFSKKYWKFALSFNLPLLAYYFSQVIFNQSDKIMIEKMCGLNFSGIYGVAYTIALLLTFVLNSINNAYLPWLYGKIEEKKASANKKMSLLISIIMCILVGGIIWITPEIIAVIAGEQYKEAIYVVAPLAISLILLLYSQFSINVLFYYKRKKELVLSSVISAIVNIALNFLLIPICGFIIAGYTTLFSYILFALFNALAIKKLISKGGELEGIYDWKLLIIIFLIFVAISYSGVALYNYLWVRIGIICFVILLLIVFRKKIYLLFKRVKNNDESN